MRQTREKFATQVRSDILSAARVLADKEGGQLQALVDEAFTDLIEEAAAPRESLSQNHAFVDGNERTTFAATYTFLAINGAGLASDAEQTYAFVAALYKANQFSFDRLVPWLRDHVTQETR